MIARIRKSIEEKDKGFTLIELLVVMIIIGILAAIAIPVFLNQRKKAVDTAAKSDVSTIGKEVATYYVDATAALATLTVTHRAAWRPADTLNVDSDSVGNASNGMTAVDARPTRLPAPATRRRPTTWCVTLTYDGGTRTTIYVLGRRTASADHLLILAQTTSVGRERTLSPHWRTWRRPGNVRTATPSGRRTTREHGWSQDRRGTPGSARRGGFTLIELVVAMVVPRARCPWPSSA